MEPGKKTKYLKLTAFAAVLILIFVFFSGINIKFSGINIIKKTPNNNLPSASQTRSSNSQKANINQPIDIKLVEEVFPSKGVELPIVWGDLGKQLIDAGVIDQAKFESLYSQRGGLDDYEKNILSGINNGKLKMTPQNANFLLNVLWPLALGNKNDILDKGEMTTSGTPTENFASTGGWTLGKGTAMDHFSKHNFINLTPDQQALVDEVSRNVYRPCCGNSTHFPDCNHGMGMLGLLELMASQGVSKADMYKYALIANSYWFPDNYLTIATYYKDIEKTDWSKVDAKTVLSQYTSPTGYQQILTKVSPQRAPSSRGGCGI